MLSINVNTTDAENYLILLQKDEQLPFAVSKAINAVARLIQDAIRGDMRSKIKFTQIAFELRAIKIPFNATKTSLSTLIQIDDSAYNLLRLESGQPHVPINGHKFIPIANAVVFGGKPIKASNPLSIGNLMLHSSPGGGLKGLQKTYTAVGDGKAPVIIQRVSKTTKGVRSPRGSRKGLDKTLGTRRLYTLVKQSTTPMKIDFYGIAQSIINEHLIDEMNKALTLAIKTAR